jgi:hypothetical protein
MQTNLKKTIQTPIQSQLFASRLTALLGPCLSNAAREGGPVMFIVQVHPHRLTADRVLPNTDAEIDAAGAHGPRACTGYIARSTVCRPSITLVFSRFHSNMIGQVRRGSSTSSIHERDG